MAKRTTDPKSSVNGKKAPASGLELLKKKKATTVEFPVCVDAEVARRRDELDGQLRKISEKVDKANLAKSISKTAPGPTVEDLAELERLEAEFADARAEADAVTITFVFKALAKRHLVALQTAHPVVKSQQRQHDIDQQAAGLPKQALQWNVETFPAALVQAACIVPVLDDDTLAEMFEGPLCEDCEGTGLDDGEACTGCGGSCRRPELGVWSQAELDGLFLAALSVNGTITV